MNVSIIIVSWQVRELLEKCLKSIFNQTTDINFEVFVIDNNSQDGTVAMVENTYPEVNLIVNDENLGFAKANNQAIVKSKGEYILLLNPDTEITDNSIQKTYKFMKGNVNIGITGCKIINPDGSIQKSIRSFPDLESHILILTKLHNFLPNSKSLKKYYLPDFDYKKTQEVQQVMGAFFMINRKMLNQIGLLDESFFIWYEEVDLCRRAIDDNWQVFYYSDAHIIHHQGKSFSKKTAIIKQFIFNRSLLRYFAKHHKIYEYLVLLILYPISLLLAAIVQILNLNKK